MPGIPFDSAFRNAPRKLALGVLVFFVLKLLFFVAYGGSAGAGGPIALLLAIFAFTKRSVLAARLLGLTLLLNAFGLGLAAQQLNIVSGPGFLVALTSAAAVTAGWGSFEYAKLLKVGTPVQGARQSAHDA